MVWQEGSDRVRALNGRRLACWPRGLLEGIPDSPNEYVVSEVSIAMPKRSAPRAGNARWSHGRLLAGLVLIFRRHLPCVGLEVIGSESKVDRDGDVLVIEDILEGFGRVPVSVDFSPVSEHMFIAFKEGEVRVYPDGGDTMFAPDFTPCLDMDDEVRCHGG